MSTRPTQPNLWTIADVVYQLALRGYRAPDSLIRSLEPKVIQPLRNSRGHRHYTDEDLAKIIAYLDSDRPVWSRPLSAIPRPNT